jgi:hypothetical protein
LYDERTIYGSEDAMPQMVNFIDAPPDYEEITLPGLGDTLFCSQHTDEVNVSRWPCDQHGPAATVEDTR